MKNPFLVACVGLLAVSLSGCIVVGIDRHHGSHETEAVEAPPVPATADSVVISEINTASNLTFENNKLEALNAIASRTTLSTSAQVHLVHKAFAKLDFEPSKVTLLQTLIKNPSLSNTTKQAILTNVSKLSFENNKTIILAALNQRGELKD